MKTIAILTFLLFAGVTENNKNELKEKKLTATNSCYWEDTYSYNVSSRRGGFGGSKTSLTVYYKNNYSYSVYVGFYLADSENRLPSRGTSGSYKIYPGESYNVSTTYSTGRYRIMVSKGNVRCDFPTLN